MKGITRSLDHGTRGSDWGGAIFLGGLSAKGFLRWGLPFGPSWKPSYLFMLKSSHLPEADRAADFLWQRLFKNWKIP